MAEPAQLRAVAERMVAAQAADHRLVTVRSGIRGSTDELTRGSWPPSGGPVATAARPDANPGSLGPMVNWRGPKRDWRTL